MKKLFTHIRSTVRVALIWAVAGALAGALVEVLNDLLPGGLPIASLVDVWPPVLTAAAFLGSAGLSAVLQFARVRRQP